MIDKEFTNALAEAIVRGLQRYRLDNVDTYRFPEQAPKLFRRVVRAMTDQLLRLARRLKFVYVGSDNSCRLAANLTTILSQIEELSSLYNSLANQESRRELISILAYRALGSGHVRLPLDTKRYWRTLHCIDAELICQRCNLTVPVVGRLNRYDLGQKGYSIELLANAPGVMNTFVLQQYRYARGETVIEVEPGDTVIDGGACWGDTALYCAYRAGENGAVHAFELSPANFDILQRNLVINPDLGRRISVHKEALWHTEGATVQFHENGPATSAVRRRGAATSIAQTETLDNFAARHKLAHVDFIKLDIEGSELNALRGARETLRTFRPRLAIAIYHQLTDFFQIPAYLKGLDIGYELFLDHFTIHAEETVLFARSSR